jgi:hypothetical protein
MGRGGHGTEGGEVNFKDGGLGTASEVEVTTADW